ncbi:MAG: adenosylmethionine--8-amino-7-oxononanoate transaminase [Chthoniobacterales bacterium]
MRSSWDTAQLVAADKRYVWHPFTAMGEWCAPEHEPILLLEGDGAIVRDSRRCEYIDGNSSIWTNIHGHNHPKINSPICAQLERVAHTSFLGTTNPPAIELAREIVQLFPPEKFGRAFFSDDGSTGIEVALRIVSQYWQLKGNTARKTFVAFRNGYHGDTAGAASLGAAALFGGGLSGWQAPVRTVASVEELKSLENHEEIAGVAIEPLIQGAAGMKIWPAGTLRDLRGWCDENGALLIADEVMTGFGRTGKMFACEHEGVDPDIYVFAKALTGGYLALALTLISHEIYEPFSAGPPLFYGHSYTGNSLGCAAALASLAVFRSEKTLESLKPKIAQLRDGLSTIKSAANTRSIGMIGAFDFPTADLARAVCAAARTHGLLTRPIREVVVLMPPLCITKDQIDSAVNALRLAVDEVLTSKINHDA